MRNMALAAAVFVLPLSGCATYTGGADSAPRAAADAQAFDANRAFEKMGADYLKGIAELNPVYATALGNHAYDDKLPDVSAKGRADGYKFAMGFLMGMRTVPFDELSRANQVDYKLLENALLYALWSNDTEQQWAWNPQYYHSIASSSLYSLVSRDYAPFEERLPNVVARMEALPAFLAQARAQVQIARVPKVHAETVAKQNAGIMGIVSGIIEPELAKSSLDRAAFDAAKAKLAAAIEEHQKWLDEEVVPGAQGEFRLGSEKYAQKMAFALQTDMSVAELKQRAETAFAGTRKSMFEVSSKIGNCAQLQVRESAEAYEQAVIECGLNARKHSRQSAASSAWRTMKRKLSPCRKFGRGIR